MIIVLDTQKIGRVRHRRINIEETTGTSYIDFIIIVIKSEKSKALKHKAMFSLLVSGLGLPALYEIIKWLIK